MHALAALLLHQALLQVAATPARQLAWQQRVRSLALTLQDPPQLCAHSEQRWLDAGHGLRI